MLMIKVFNKGRKRRFLIFGLINFIITMKKLIFIPLLQLIILMSLQKVFMVLIYEKLRCNSSKI